MPGRLIGVSIDAQGNRALKNGACKLESNILNAKKQLQIFVPAQALLANMAADVCSVPWT